MTTQLFENCEYCKQLIAEMKQEIEKNEKQ